MQNNTRVCKWQSTFRSYICALGLVIYSRKFTYHQKIRQIWRKKITIESQHNYCHLFFSFYFLEIPKWVIFLINREQSFSDNIEIDSQKLRPSLKKNLNSLKKTSLIISISQSTNILSPNPVLFLLHLKICWTKKMLSLENLSNPNN